MNAARRKTIRGIIEKLEAIKADIEEAKEAVDDVAAEEREAFDNMPEGAQASDRGQGGRQRGPRRLCRQGVRPRRRPGSRGRVRPARAPGRSGIRPADGRRI